MTCLEWSRQMSALRAGELRLVAPGEDGLSLFARGHLDDLREYLRALEHGYRAVCEKLDAYRKRERTGSVKCGRQTMGDLLANQWSKPAALGYAAAALRQSGQNPSQVVGVLELMEELMDEHPRAWAEGVYQEMVEDPGGDGDADCHESAFSAESPVGSRGPCRRSFRAAEVSGPYGGTSQAFGRLEGPRNDRDGGGGHG